jgi:pilus assembly protein CpaF
MLERERRMSTPPAGPLISVQPKKRAGLDFRVYLDLKIGIHRELLNHLNLEKVATQPDDHVRRQVYASIQGVAANLKTPPSAPELTPTEKERLLFEVLEEVFRLGPLEPLLQDPTISDILVNGAQEVYIERAGVLEESRTIF